VLDESRGLVLCVPIVPAARAGIFLNLEPLVGTLLGVFITGESLGALGILGGALILFAAAYFSRPKAA